MKKYNKPGIAIIIYFTFLYVIYVNYIYHVLEFIPVDKDYIPPAFKYSARIENQHLIKIFLAFYISTENISITEKTFKITNYNI